MEAISNPIRITNSELAQVEAYQHDIQTIFRQEYAHLADREQFYTNINTVTRFSIAREFEQKKVV
jgi:hypothetical protein